MIYRNEGALLNEGLLDFRCGDAKLIRKLPDGDLSRENDLLLLRDQLLDRKSVV